MITQLTQTQRTATIVAGATCFLLLAAGFAYSHGYAGGVRIATAMGKSRSVPGTTFCTNPYQVGALTPVTLTIPEFEETIAIDPTDSSQLVAGITDVSSNIKNQATRYAV